MSKATIIEGTFALVSSGNCTESYMVDGDDIQERANAAHDSYWGPKSNIIERGIEGFAVAVNGWAGYMVDLYTTRASAEAAISEVED